MNKEVAFALKVLRNGFILSGIFFGSIWATGTLTWELMKPIGVFYVGYFFAELGRHYRLSPTTKSMKELLPTTFVF